MILEGSPVGGSFNSKVVKSTYSHFHILSTVFCGSGGIPSATTTKDEQGRSLTDPPGNLRCSSPSVGNTGGDVTMETSAGRRVKAGIPIPAS